MRRSPALLRFATTHTGDDTAEASPWQITYRVCSRNRKKFTTSLPILIRSAASSPHLEVFRKKGIEVLAPVRSNRRVGHGPSARISMVKSYAISAAVNWILMVMTKQRQIQSRMKASTRNFLSGLREQLKNEVESVRLTDRLTDSPACLAIGEFDMGAQMRKIMEASGQQLPDSKPIFRN